MPQSLDESAIGICRHLACAFGVALEWKWDGRFGTALAEFPSGDSADALGALNLHLVSRWDIASIADAPEAVQALRKHLGGLMTGQLLLLSDPAAEPLVYCAWWPWGNGQRVSIRIGIFGSGSDQDAVLRSAFGIS